MNPLIPLGLLVLSLAAFALANRRMDMAQQKAREAWNLDHTHKVIAATLARTASRQFARQAQVLSWLALASILAVGVCLLYALSLAMNALLAT